MVFLDEDKNLILVLNFVNNELFYICDMVFLIVLKLDVLFIDVYFVLFFIIVMLLVFLFFIILFNIFVIVVVNFMYEF